MARKEKEHYRRAIPILNWIYNDLHVSAKFVDLAVSAKVVFW